MAKQVHFFVSTKDLVAAASRVDEAINVKLVRNGLHDTESLDTYNGLSAIPNLGCNTTGLAAGAGSFIVLPHDENVPIKKVVMAYEQGTRYRFDLTAHDRWIYFEPGGETDAESTHKLVVGKVGTNLPNKESIDLYNSFKRAFTKGFKKHAHGVLIAPDAATKESISELVW